MQKDEQQDGAGTLVIAWGTHKLTAPVKLDLVAARAAAAKTNQDDDDDDEKDAQGLVTAGGSIPGLGVSATG